ncbi:MAG: lamin tail domain-containing protein [Myxococcales bacterium]|nr:lamin tail domain-containing protein [Myxococcales bacterium]MCB9736659.1 lamin tail domain-containing protein [Deltaproteobacteria bacterium]
MTRRLALFTTLCLALPVAACDSGTTTPEDEAPVGQVVEAGKADDFYSLSAREYYVEGTTSITLGSSWAAKSVEAREAEVKRLVPYKQVVIGWFLSQYMVDKEHGANDSYGGFRALTKNGSWEDLALEQVDDLTWRFSFRQELGGQIDLIKAIPDATSTGSGTWEFDLIVGKIGNEEMQRLETDAEWYRSSPWGEFDPTKVSDDRKEVVRLTIKPETASTDAWIDQARLFEDGKVTVGVHFGWDYHASYHEKHSRSVYDWLVARGFKSPVAGYDALRHDSGPLTKTVRWHGKDVAVEVSLFWGQKGLDTDPDTAAGGRQLEKDMLESLEKREVVVFSGHSGPFYGFALANWRMTSEGDLDDSELVDVPLNTGHYQLIVAEGCDTYALGQAFYDNPTKDGLEDLDVLTTTSFSNASTPATVTSILAALFGEQAREATPVRYAELLKRLDGNSSWFTTMYGVHGIDDNPTVHPWADLAASCKTCSRHADCGDGMQCVGMKDGKKGCAAICTASTGCGAGRECRNVQTGGYLTQSLCVPSSLSCAAPVEEPVVVLVNEIHPNPATDTNGDGVVSGTNDEFVEIVNASAVEVDLAGWSVSDAVGVRHVFPAKSVLAPGGAVVVFGGGAPGLEAGTTLVQTASTGRLGLNNGGDEVKLVDVDGRAVALVKYGAEVEKGESLQRAVDGDKGDAFDVTGPTPGAKRDGARF